MYEHVIFIVLRNKTKKWYTFITIKNELLLKVICLIITFVHTLQLVADRYCSGCVLCGSVCIQTGPNFKSSAESRESSQPESTAFNNRVINHKQAENYTWTHVERVFLLSFLLR